MVRVADCVPVLLADPAQASSVPRTPGATGWSRAWCEACVDADARARCRARSRRGSGRTSAVPATRSPRRSSRRWRPWSRRRCRRPPGARPRSTSVPASRAQLERAGVDGPRRLPLHPGVARPLLLPTRRGGRRPVRRRDQDEAMSDRGAEIEAGLAAVRDRIEAACAAAGREPRRDHPRRGHQVLPGLRRPPARRPRRPRTSGRTGTRRRSRRRPSAPTSTCAGTSSAACRATRRRPSRRTPTWCTPSTAPSWSTGLSRGAEERGRDLDCLVQVSLDPPEAAGRSGCEPADVPALVERIGEADGAAAARRDGGRAARRGPRRGLRPAGRGRVRRTRAGAGRRPGSRPA